METVDGIFLGLCSEGAATLELDYDSTRQLTYIVSLCPVDDRVFFTATVGGAPMFHTVTPNFILKWIHLLGCCVRNSIVKKQKCQSHGTSGSRAV